MCAAAGPHSCALLWHLAHHTTSMLTPSTVPVTAVGAVDRMPQLRSARALMSLSTPHTLHYRSLPVCSQEGHEQLVELLLSRGADLHAGADSPLRLAAQHGNVGVVQCLLLHGANLHVDDDEPLRVAASRRHSQVVKLL